MEIISGFLLTSIGINKNIDCFMFVSISNSVDFIDKSY